MGSRDTGRIQPTIINLIHQCRLASDTSPSWFVDATLSKTVIDFVLKKDGFKSEDIPRSTASLDHREWIVQTGVPIRQMNLTQKMMPVFPNT
jgi:hypothetical protein